MTVASLVQAEARGDDMPKVARVIYNRLETEGAPDLRPAPDRRDGQLRPRAEARGGAHRRRTCAIDSPYNTYLYPGLPPGPIEAPGDAGDRRPPPTRPTATGYFYVTVNLRTGETKFAETYEEFLQYKAEFQEYCQTSEAC